MQILHTNIAYMLYRAGTYAVELAGLARKVVTRRFSDIAVTRVVAAGTLSPRSPTSCPSASHEPAELYEEA